VVTQSHLVSGKRCLVVKALDLADRNAAERACNIEDAGTNRFRPQICRQGHDRSGGHTVGRIAKACGVRLLVNSKYISRHLWTPKHPWQSLKQIAKYPRLHMYQMLVPFEAGLNEEAVERRQKGKSACRDELDRVPKRPARMLGSAVQALAY
jgi:hypothetical protein